MSRTLFRELVDWAAHGPAQAEVDSIEVLEEPVRGERGFRVI